MLAEALLAAFAAWCVWASFFRAAAPLRLPAGASHAVEDVAGVPSGVVRAGAFDAARPLLVVVLPGNPGQPLFYAATAVSLARAARARVCVLSHAGHCARAGARGFFDLPAQAAHALAGVRAEVRAAPRGAALVIVGHSIGAWLALEALRAPDLARARAVLWMPTLAHIARARKARALAPLLFCGRTLAGAAGAAAAALPLAAQRALVAAAALPRGAAPALVDATVALLSRRVAINALWMAADELRRVGAPDAAHGAAVGARCAALFVEGDAWNDHAGADAAAARALLPGARVVHDAREGHTHGFVLHAASAARVAARTAEWIDELLAGARAGAGGSPRPRAPSRAGGSRERAAKE